MTAAELEADQKPLPRNLLVDFLFGARAAGVSVRDVLDVAGRQLRLYEPQKRDTEGSALLYFHGGGWVSGDPNMTDWWCSQYAARTGALVASIDYRLAPKHRFPAGLTDGYSALCWLHDQSASLKLDTQRIGVAGDSAGANLAAALCLYARERNGPAIASQTLICPALDLSLGSCSIAENANAPLLSEQALRAYVRHYLGDATPASNPLASPLLAADHSQLPPALIQVAEHDPLRDDGWRYAARLRAAGNHVRVTEYAGSPHGLTTFPGLTPLSAAALEEACVFNGKAG